MRGHADEFGSTGVADADRAHVRRQDVPGGLLGLQRSVGNRALSAALTHHSEHGPLPGYVVQRACCGGCESGGGCETESPSEQAAEPPGMAPA